MANLREGLVPQEAELAPEQWFGKNGFKAYLTGTPLTRLETERIIKDYYNEWGWDLETGVPPAQELARLGLIDRTTKEEAHDAGIG